MSKQEENSTVAEDPKPKKEAVKAGMFGMAWGTRRSNERKPCRQQIKKIVGYKKLGLSGIFKTSSGGPWLN